MCSLNTIYYKYYYYYNTGLILSVESNQNVESKMKNVESKPQNCGVQKWVATEQPVFCTFA